MPFSGSSPTPTAARPARQGSISHRQRLLSTTALSVDEEIRRSEGGGFAVPMDGSSSPVVGGAVRRLKADDPETGLPLHRRRGSLPRQMPDANLRPSPVVNSTARAEAASPLGSSIDLPPSPSSSTRTFTPAYSLGRAQPPRSPLSTPLSELPPEQPLDPLLPSPSDLASPPSPGRSVQDGSPFVFPLSIPPPSASQIEPPSSDAASDAQPLSQRVVPRLHLRTASGADVGLPSIQSLPRGPSGFRGLGRRPSVSGSPSPTREVFWGGQAGTARKSSAAVTPVGSDDGQTPLTPGGSVRILRPLPSPRGEFNLNTGKMLTVRARVATPKGERSAFIGATQSCPPLHSPLPSPASSPVLAVQMDLPASPPTEQQAHAAVAPGEERPMTQAFVTQGLPSDPSRRTSVLSFTSGSSGLSTSSSATAGTLSALDTPSLVHTSTLALPKPHSTVSKPPDLLPVESAPTTPAAPADGTQTGALPPLPVVLRSHQSVVRPGSSRRGSLRRRSGQGALKLSLTDDERPGKGSSRFPTLLLDDLNGDESDDLLSAFPSSGHRTSESSLSRKSSGPSLLAELRKSSTASYMSISSVRSEPFAYDEGWSGSDDSNDETIPLPKPRSSLSRSSNGLAPPVPALPRRFSGQLAPALASYSVESQPDSAEASPHRSSSLPVSLSSPGSTLRPTSLAGTARPQSQGDPRSSLFFNCPESSGLSTSAATQSARPSSVFSLTGSGDLVSLHGRIFPRPRLNQAEPWGDVEIAYQSGDATAVDGQLTGNVSQVSNLSQAKSSTTGRQWEEAAERLPDRKKLIGRRDIAASSASGYGSSLDVASLVPPTRIARAPPSALKDLPAPPLAASQTASPAMRSIPIRKASSSSQLRSVATGPPTYGGSPSRLPSSTIKKSYSSNIPQYRSPAGSTSPSPAGLKQLVRLPTIEPLRITRPGALSPQPPTSHLDLEDKPLSLLPSVGDTSMSVPHSANLQPRTPPRTQSEDTTPTQTLVASVGRDRTSDPLPSTIPPVDTTQGQPLLTGVETPLSPKPAFGPAAGRRMSKRPSVSKARAPLPMQHRFYEAPPLPPLPALPAVFTSSQPR